MSAINQSYIESAKRAVIVMPGARVSVLETANVAIVNASEDRPDGEGAFVEAVIWVASRDRIAVEKTAGVACHRFMSDVVKSEWCIRCGRPQAEHG